MTTAVLIDHFNILQDKYGSPNLIESEILKLLNMAQWERFNRLLPDDMGGVVNFEYDENVSQNIRPFIYTLNSITTNSGLLSNSTINSALVAESESGAEIFRVLKMSWAISGRDYPIKFVRNNNINQYKRNYFKAPSTTNPKYSLLADGLQIYPTNDSLPIQLTVIKKPRTLTALNSPEWDDYNLNQILTIALQYAQVATRDNELLASIQQANISK